ncbi:MAG: Gfo/Idh/MocA family protein [Phycisphaerae bacterium]
MAEDINIALFGQKFMARAHCNAYLKVSRFFNLTLNPVLHTISDRDLIALAPFADRWGWKNYNTNWKEVAKDPAIGLVDISTPTYSHAEQALVAIAAGKHVICESPIAASIKEARQMKNAATKSRKVKTFVWYNYRRCPAVALAHFLITGGKLGKVIHTRAQFLQNWAQPDEPLSWRFQKKYSGYGAHAELNAQIIDIMRFVTGGEIAEVSGAVAETFVPERVVAPAKDARTGARRKAKGKVDVDDALAFVARYENGALGVFESSRLANGNQNQLSFEINTEFGAIRFSLEDMNYLWVYDNRMADETRGWTRILATHAGVHPYAGAWWPDGHIIGFEHTYINMLADVLAVLGGDKPILPVVDFADAYETQRVLEAAALAARNRAAVKLAEIR